MRFFFTATFILFNVFVLLAQSDFRSGYVITNKSDTLHGLIAYRSDNTNANKCVFKKAEDAEVQIFKPNQIRGYRYLNSKYYVSKTIPKGDETKLVFLEYLINGIIDVFHYRDAEGRHYYLEDENGKLYELKNEEKEVIVDNKQYIRESKEYIGLLKAIFKESPTITKRTENVSLSHKALIKITRDYHNQVCHDEKCIVYKKTLPKRDKSFGVVAGLSAMEVVQIGELTDWYYYLKGSDFGLNIYPSVGLYYKVGMPGINERLFFQYEGNYSYVSVSTLNLYFEPVYQQSKLNDLNLKQHSISNIGIIRYELPKGKIRPTLHAGLFLKYSFSEFTRDLTVRLSNGDIYNRKQFKNNGNEFTDFGFNCGFGINYTYFKNKILFIDFRYQRGFGEFPKMNTNTFIMSLGFQII